MGVIVFMFNFKLQSALNYRKSIEEKKLVDFSEGKKLLEKEIKTLEAILSEQAELLGQLKKMQGGHFNAADVALYLSYIELFKEKKNHQQEVVQKASREVDAQREALLEALKNRKSMDVLKENQFQEYQENMAAFERKASDETAVLRFARRNK